MSRGNDELSMTVRDHFIVEAFDTFDDEYSADYTYAKITKVLANGFYEADQVKWDSDTESFVEVEGVLEWRDDNLKLYEINAVEDVSKDSIVVVTPAFGSAPIWVFTIGDGGGFGIGGAKTDKSNTVVGGRIQFRSDVTFDSTATQLPVPDELGGASDGGIRVYSGNEKGNYGRQRNYNWLWNGKNMLNDSSSSEVGVGEAFAGDLTLSMLIPQTDATMGGGTAVDIDDWDGSCNARHIKFWRHNHGHTVEIYHGVIPADYLPGGSKADTDFLFPENGGVFYVSSTSGGAVDKKVIIDYLGHVWEYNGTTTGKTPYTPVNENADSGIDLTLTDSDYPSTGTLFNVAIGQSTALLDGPQPGGAGTNDNTGALNLSYSAVDSGGNTIEIGENTGVSNSDIIVLDSTDDAIGVGEGGNVDDINWNLSRVLDGRTVYLEVSHNSTGDTDTDEMSVDDVYMNMAVYDTGTTTPVTTIPDASDFDIWCWLTKGAGGAEWDRMNGLDEYRIRFEFLYESDGAEALAPQYVTVDSFDSGSKSGGILVTQVDFDSIRAGENLCIYCFLEFFDHADAVEVQYGECIVSQGSFVSECNLLAGTQGVGNITNPATDGQTFSSSGSDTGTDSNGLTIFTLDNPITVEYEVTVSGAASALWDLKIANIQLWKGGTQVRFAIAGSTELELEQSIVLDGNSSFSDTITAIDSSEIANGQWIIKVVDVPGVVNVQRSINFASGSSGFAWSDSFGDNSTDLPFPWSDFGAESEQQSTDTSGEPFTDRWTDASGGVGTKSSAINASGNFVANIDNNTTSPAYIEIDNKATVQDQAFRITTEVTIPADNSDTNHTTYAITGFDIGGSSNSMHLYLVRSNASASPPSGIDTTSDNWSIISNKRVSGSSSYTEHETNVTQTNWIELSVSYDGSSTVTFSWDTGSSTGSTTQSISGDISRMMLYANAGSTTANQQFYFRNTKIEIQDKDGNWINYWSPNSDRWNEPTPTGTAYQLVDSTNNKLQQIITGTSGSQKISLENVFKAHPTGSPTDITDDSWEVEAKCESIDLHANGDDQYIELLESGVNDMRMGYRYTGGQQELYFYDGSTYQVNEASSATSGTLKCNRGDFTFNDFDSTDDQATPDSSDPLNDGIWQQRWSDSSGTSGGSGSESVSSGVFTLVGNASWPNYYDHVYLSVPTFLSTQKVKAAVDARIVSDVNAATRNNGITITLIVNGVDQTIFLTNDNNSAAPPSNKGTSGSWKVIILTGGTFYDHGSYTVGSFKNIAIEYDNGNMDFLIDGVSVRTSSVTTGTVRPRLNSNNQGTTANQTAEFKNYVLTVDDVEYVEKRVLFSENGALRYAHDDSGDDLEDIDIVLESSANPISATWSEITIKEAGQNYVKSLT